LKQIAVLRIPLNREANCAAPKIPRGERRESSDDVEIDGTDRFADFDERKARRILNKWEGGRSLCAARGEER
jgi:hypothetical protein